MSYIVEYWAYMQQKFTLIWWRNATLILNMIRLIFRVKPTLKLYIINYIYYYMYNSLYVGRTLAVEWWLINFVTHIRLFIYVMNVWSVASSVRFKWLNKLMSNNLYLMVWNTSCSSNIILSLVLNDDDSIILYVFYFIFYLSYSSWIEENTKLIQWK